MNGFMKIVLILLLMSSALALAGTPTEVLVPIENIYAPEGYTTNDDVEVVVTGYLPDLCHRSPKTRVQVKQRKIMITVSSLRYAPTESNCSRVVVPFFKIIKVGVLNEGEYEIIVNAQSIYEKRDIIKISDQKLEESDGYLYLGVEHIEKEYGSRVVKIKGHNPSNCLVLEEIKIIDNGFDTYTILPKMKRVSDFCPIKMLPFSYEVKIPNTLPRKLVLLHVRSMNSSSINTLFDNSFTHKHLLDGHLSH